MASSRLRIGPAVGLGVSRRDVLVGLSAFGFSMPAFGFGQDGAFNPRPLLVSGAKGMDKDRESALGRWSWELVRCTSAPGRLVIRGVAPDEPKLWNEPFAVWFGSETVGPLSEAEIRGLRQFFDLGGVLFVDDSNPATGDFGKSARRELARVLPEVPVVPTPPGHVIYKSYYLIPRAVGRVDGPERLHMMRRGRQVSVLFSDHDLLGALARSGDTWALPMQSADPLARTLVVRFAVNIAMFVLCLDYKDDQVHAEELMRRRGRAR